MYYNYFYKKKNGYFVEIGAHDGISMSNTYFFEKSSNWKGVLIEGGERNCKNLHANSIHRKNAIIVCSAICSSKYVNFKENNFTGKIVHTNNTYDLTKCNTLKNITNIYKIKKIDLFSLDVEGGELEVLETFDFNVIVSHWLIE